jgi:hypothetical protein
MTTLLRDSGFVDVERFYAALSFQGWVASVPWPDDVRTQADGMRNPGRDRRA